MWAHCLHWWKGIGWFFDGVLEGIGGYWEDRSILAALDMPALTYTCHPQIGHHLLDVGLRELWWSPLEVRAAESQAAHSSSAAFALAAARVGTFALLRLIVLFLLELADLLEDLRLDQLIHVQGCLQRAGTQRRQAGTQLAQHRMLSR